MIQIPADFIEQRGVKAGYHTKENLINQIVSSDYVCSDSKTSFRTSKTISRTSVGRKQREQRLNSPPLCLTAGGNEKLHVQSLCAMAHFDFNTPGAHSYEEAFRIMRELRLPYKDAEQQYRRMVFNSVRSGSRTGRLKPSGRCIG